MSKIDRRDFLKVLGTAGIVFGGISANISGLGKLLIGNTEVNPEIGMDKSYGADLIEPGTIIDSGNYKNFPQLKELLPEHQYLRLKRGATRSDLPPIKVVPTRKLRLSKSEQEWAEKNRNVVKLDPKTKMLVNWKAGRPFPEPKNIYEVTWNYLKRHWYGDAFHFPNVTFVIVDKLNRIKTMDLSLWHRPFKGRTTVPPVPEYPDNPDNILWKQTTLFVKPYDVAGFAALRHRYDSLEKDDDMWAYMPAIRRLRRFTGADYQDPLFGSDNTYDDFAHWLQKIDFKNVLPTKVEEGKILVWSYHTQEAWDGHQVKIDKRQGFYPSWEIRPVYKVTVEIKDPSYMYSKRVTWIDKETYLSNYAEFYDQKGNLFRSWHSGYWWTEEGGHHWIFVEMEDWINGSKTYLQCTTTPYNPTFSDKVFSKTYLKRLLR
jgi:hypothetical protein